MLAVMYKNTSREGMIYFRALFIGGKNTMFF